MPVVKTLKAFFAPKDMTEGAPWKRIAEFMIPMLIGNVAQQLYNTADSIIVGRYIGDNALAAVGSAGPILNLLIVLFMGISMGAGIMVSQYFGAKDRENLSRAIGNSIVQTVIASVIIMVLGPLISRPLLILMNTPPSILDWCAGYLNIFFLGGAGFAFYNMLAGILRGLGDSLSALVFYSSPPRSMSGWIFCSSPDLTWAFPAWLWPQFLPRNFGGPLFAEVTEDERDL